MENRILFTNSESRDGLSLPELEMSYRAESFGSRSRTKPMEHYEFINRLQEGLTTSNIPFGMKKIFINKNDVQLMCKKNEDVPMTVNNFRINRLVGRIIMTDLQNEESEYSIAYGYSDRGFELAMGLNVRVCQNLSIFAAEVLRTFGPKRISMAEILTRFMFWLQSMEASWNVDNLIARSMKEFAFPNEVRDRMLVDLTYRSYGSNDGDPFNQGEAKALMVETFKKNPENMWDFYNIGTGILHPKNLNNTERMIGMNQEFGLYVMGLMPQVRNAMLNHKEWMEQQVTKLKIIQI